MSDTMTVSEARAALPRLLDRVQAGEEITVTRHGEPVAVLVRPDNLRVRRIDAKLAAAERIASLIDEATRRDLRQTSAVDESRAEELIRFIRDSRARA